MTRRDFWILVLILLLGAAVTAHQKMRQGIRPFDIRVEGLDFLQTPTHVFTESGEAEWSADGRLLIDAVRGDVTVRGWDEPRLQVEMHKEIRSNEEADAQRLAENLKLELSSSSAGMEARAVERPGFRRPRGIRTDFLVSAPRALELVIRTTHGAVRVEEMQGGLRVETSHGPVKAHRVRGRCEIINRYGAVRATEVDGALQVTNEHDDVNVKQIAGTVRIQSEYGRVSVEDAEGGVEVLSRHGEVVVSRIREAVRVEAPHCAITIEEVEGPVTAKGEVDPLRLQHIQGTAEVEADWSSVYLEEVKGRVRVEGNHTDVRLIRPGGNVEIRTSHQDVDLTPPVGSGFRVKAEAERGEIETQVPELALPDEPVERFTGIYGDGRHLYLLTTTYSTIRIRAPR